MMIDTPGLPVVKRWPCGHEEQISVPNFEARKESTFYGPDEGPEPTECSICAAAAVAAETAASAAEALRVADVDNRRLERKVHRLKDRLRLRLEADARVDKLIDLVAKLVERRE